MSRFAVLLKVSGLLLRRERKLVAGGLFAWRCVQADSAGDAVSPAIRNLIADPEYVMKVWNSADAPPSFKAERVDELDGDFDPVECDNRITFWLEAPEWRNLPPVRTGPAVT
jgi:hypothetical protein